MRLDPSRAGAAATIALHAVVLAVLLSYAPARSALLAAAPIMVDWIAAPKQEAPPEPPKPKPVVKRPAKPVEPKPVTAAQPEVPTPSPILAPAPPPPAPEPVAIAPAPAPVAVTPPIFNAAYLENPAPLYPVLSRRIREEGRVVLRVLVNPRGSADEVQISNSSGHPRLDDSARDTVRRWRFIPAKRGSEPVSAWVLVPVSFKLEG